MTVCAVAGEATYGAGVLEVERLVGVAEDDSRSSTGVDGYTYAELRVVEPFFFHDGSPTEVVVRLHGGPIGMTDDGRIRFTGTFVELAVGARVAGFMRAGTQSYNAGFPDLIASRVFYPAPDSGGGSWYLFDVQVSTETLGDAARAAYGSFRPGEFHTDQCGIEIDFDRCPAESLIPASAQRWDNPCPD